jgi:hypothetical protein
MTGKTTCACGAEVTIDVRELGQSADGLHRAMIDARHAGPLCDAWKAGTVALLPLLSAAGVTL